jgi:hypothetical protein
METALTIIGFLAVIGAIIYGLLWLSDRARDRRDGKG